MQFTILFYSLFILGGIFILHKGRQIYLFMLDSTSYRVVTVVYKCSMFINLLRWTDYSAGKNTSDSLIGHWPRAACSDDLRNDQTDGMQITP